jgi:hypothetical protein
MDRQQMREYEAEQRRREMAAEGREERMMSRRNIVNSVEREVRIAAADLGPETICCCECGEAIEPDEALPCEVQSDLGGTWHWEPAFVCKACDEEG